MVELSEADEVVAVDSVGGDVGEPGDVLPPGGLFPFEGLFPSGGVIPPGGAIPPGGVIPSGGAFPLPLPVGIGITAKGEELSVVVGVIEPNEVLEGSCCEFEALIGKLVRVFKGLKGSSTRPLARLAARLSMDGSEEGITVG